MVRTVLLTALGLLVWQAPSATALVSGSGLVALESMGSDRYCGRLATGALRCFSGQSELFAPEGIDQPQPATIVNESLGCGFDSSDVLRCWHFASEMNRTFAGLSLQVFLRRYLQSLVPSSIKTAFRSIYCGIEKDDGQFSCFFSDYYGSKLYAPAGSKTVSKFAVDESLVCWVDGDAIECFSPSYSAAPRPPAGAFTDMTELLVAQQLVCARGALAARCWQAQSGSTRVIDLPSEFAAAAKWQIDPYSICGLKPDGVIFCVDLDGNPPRYGGAAAIPPEYQAPNNRVLDFWRSGYTLCVLDQPPSQAVASLRCWYDRAVMDVTFDEPVRRIVTSSDSRPCVELESGAIACALGTRVLSAASPIRASYNGTDFCFWNSSGLSCPGEFTRALNSLKNIRDVAVAASGGLACAIGEGKTGSDRDRPVSICALSEYSNLTLDAAKLTAPSPLTDPTNIAVNNLGDICATDGDRLLCWGKQSFGTNGVSAVKNPKKLELTSDHGCVLDDWGLACWSGQFPDPFAPPAALAQPGLVIDFAVRAGSTCAILADQTMLCWGPDLTPGAPVLTGATSIIAGTSSYCALDQSGPHCWGLETEYLPK